MELSCVLLPMSPVFLSCPIIFIHNSSFNGCPSRQDVILDEIFLQDILSPRNFLLIREHGSKVCEEWFVSSRKILSQKEHKAMSTIVFFSPDICTTCIGTDLLMCIHNGIVLRRYPVTCNVGVLLCCIQCTAASLTQKFPTCACCSSPGNPFVGKGEDSGRIEELPVVKVW